MYMNALQNKYHLLPSDAIRPICIPHPETIPDDIEKVFHHLLAEVWTRQGRRTSPPPGTQNLCPPPCAYFFIFQILKNQSY